MKLRAAAALAFVGALCAGGMGGDAQAELKSRPDDIGADFKCVAQNIPPRGNEFPWGMLLAGVSIGAFWLTATVAYHKGHRDGYIEGMKL